MSRIQRTWPLAILILSFGLLAGHSSRSDDFVNFESSHVHPIALSDDGLRLFAVNTPEARLAVFRVGEDGELEFESDIPVGLEPVSLAVRPGTREVWVANHLSDSVSIVDTVTRTLVATLRVGDEPTDIVFASGRAFISLAGKEDRLVVYDATTLARIANLKIFGDDPRALAASPDGERVALVVLESGNGTTTVHHGLYTPDRQPPDPIPARDPIYPPGIPEQPTPREPLIVQYDPVSELWLDEAGADWSDLVFFGEDVTLPDHDLFWIDATANPPHVIQRVPRVGTNLFDVAIHPKTGEAWVSNTDAHNLIRFEPVLRGHLVETRVSRVDPDRGSVDHIDLNPHIDRTTTPGTANEISKSIATPGDGAFGRWGRKYYVTSFGSSKIAVVDAYTGELTDRIEVGGGPSGLAVHPNMDRLYVMQRFSNTISTVHTRRAKLLGEIGVAGPRAFDPSPRVVREGRRLLYDGPLSSGHGDISCATCHVFGNFDGIGWDLGDPQGAFIPWADAPWITNLQPANALGFDPMKGPMVTQTLRGLKGTEPLHWRADRENFQHFNGAFVSLLGRDTPIPDADMDLFTDFIMSVEYPPNPHRNLNDSLRTSIPGHGNPIFGANIFDNISVTPGGATCVSCHAHPIGSNHSVLVLADQATEVAQLRNVYEKFGLDRFAPLEASPEQRKTGFGIFHHGAFGVRDFLETSAPALGEALPDMTAFLASFPTGTFPCVGHQESVDVDSSAADQFRVRLLLAEARRGRCDVIATGRMGESDVGYVYDAAENEFRPDSMERTPASSFDLFLALEPGDLMTLMGVPPGSGERLGIDRDRDGCLNGDELRSGTDPANPGTPTQDSDADGLHDEIDLCPGWVQKDSSQTDKNGNRVPDECECGDVTNDGEVDWSDVKKIWFHVRGDEPEGSVALEKCNVSGKAGNTAELCDFQDLVTTFRYVWQKSANSNSEPPPLESRCLPEPPPSPAPMMCVDGAL